MIVTREGRGSAATHRIATCADLEMSCRQCHRVVANRDSGSRIASPSLLSFFSSTEVNAKPPTRYILNTLHIAVIIHCCCQWRLVSVSSKRASLTYSAYALSSFWCNLVP